MERPTETVKHTIYQDLDGCLTDFEGQFSKYSGGHSFRDYILNYGESKAWDIIDEVGITFWSKMPWLQQGIKLWDYIKKHNPIILSSPGRSELAVIGKKIWVKNNLPGTELILAQSYEKRRYASENSVLVDDYWKNIWEWKRDGGIGVIFKNFNQTIKQLKDYGI